MNNVVILMGVICRNIDLKETSTGKKTCNVTLAITRNYKNNNGEYESDFVTCKAFGQKAELLSSYCKKGDTIGIKGNILTGSYEKDGKKVYFQDILVQDINFIKQGKQEIKIEQKEKPKKDVYEEFGKEITEMDLPF